MQPEPRRSPDTSIASHRPRLRLVTPGILEMEAWGDEPSAEPRPRQPDVAPAVPAAPASDGERFGRGLGYGLIIAVGIWLATGLVVLAWLSL